MFKDLYQLFNSHRNSNRTPLEDFNTEAFANILKLYPSILNEYVVQFLQLPDGVYKVSTQVFKQLPDDQDCIVDLVFESDEVICFVENKVESSEGYHQLERYAKALQLYYPDKKQYLHYCTKYTDPKDKCKLEVEFFKQYRWFEVAKFLNPFAIDYPIVKDYRSFLNEHKMAQDNTIRIENLLSMENMKKSVEVCQFYIENSLNDFEERFGHVKKDISYHWAQVRDHNRVSYLLSDVLTCSDKKWSELLYSFEFDQPRLNVQLFVDHRHSQYKKFIEKSKAAKGFIFKVNDSGATLCLEQSLGSFLNNEECDKLIKDWFKESFDKMIDFVKETKEDLDWRDDFLKKDSNEKS